MIIFYNKKTGSITGTIDGRIHTDQQLSVSIGNKDETDKIICQWIVTKEWKEETEEGMINRKKYEPDHPQKKLFMELDKKSSDIYKYKLDLKTKLLKPRDIK